MCYTVWVDEGAGQPVRPQLMFPRRAVLQIPAKSSVPPRLPIYKFRSTLTPSKSTLTQLLIPLHFISFISNTYKKPARGTLPSASKFCNSSLHAIPSCERLPTPANLMLSFTCAHFPSRPGCTPFRGITALSVPHFCLAGEPAFQAVAEAPVGQGIWRFPGDVCGATDIQGRRGCERDEGYIRRRYRRPEEPRAHQRGAFARRHGRAVQEGRQSDRTARPRATLGGNEEGLRCAAGPLAVARYRLDLR